MAKSVVLLVDDNPDVRQVISTGLIEEEGYDVITAGSVREFSEKIATAKPDIVLLDLVLPDGDGLTLIKTIREHTNAPVIVISGKSDLIDKVVGLEMGADDYVGKPIQMKEIAARIKAQLRRYKSMQQGGEGGKKRESDRIRFGAWILDRKQFQIFDGSGNSGALTANEFKLLETLALEPNRVFSRVQLLDKVHADNYDTTDRAIDVQILRIRKKIGDRPGSGEIIRSVRSIGYMFVAETEAV